MFDPVLLAGFIAASLAVLALPGPGVVFVVTQSAAFGARAGIASTFGLSLGAFVHVIAAALGLSALMLASSTAFSIIKWIGAAYLIYLGLKMILARDTRSSDTRPVDRPLQRLFLDGVVVSVFNPKIAVFFLAYLPHFVDPSKGSVTLQIMALGALYCVLAVCTDGAYALLAARLRAGFVGSRLARRWTRMLGGGIFIVLGIHTALATRVSNN